jgi:hypothetical protein
MPGIGARKANKHRRRKRSRSADLLSPQRVALAERAVIYAACGKQEDTLEAAMLKRREEAWVHAECCGLEVRAPGLFGLRRSSLKKTPFPHVRGSAAAPTARRIQPWADRALASAALEQTSTHHPPAQGRALNGRGRACATERQPCTAQMISHPFLRSFRARPCERIPRHPTPRACALG